MIRVLLRFSTVLIFCFIFFLLFSAANTSASDYTFPQIKIYDSQGKSIKAEFLAYDGAFKGGANVAMADVDGNGRDEIIVGAGPGGGPQVRVFRQDGKFTGWQIFPFHPNFRGGVDVAAGDIDGDGKAEIIVSQASAGQAWVKVYNYDKNFTILSNFLAYAPEFEGGAHVASGDIDGDGQDEIVTGAGLGGGPHVRAFEGSGSPMGIELFPFSMSFRGGVDVAVGNVDGGDCEEIIVGQAQFGQAWVKTYKTNQAKQVLGEFLAYPSSHKEGVNLAAGDIDNDGEDEIVTGTGGNGPQVRAFEAYGAVLPPNFFSYHQDFRGGVKVAVGNVVGDRAKEIVTSPGRRVIEGRPDLYKYIEVDISEQTLRAYHRGRKIAEFLISTGLSKYPTPLGTFRILSKIPSTRMTWYYGPDNPDNYDLPNVPHVLPFYGPYAIHGTYWHNNFGYRMSHGCVNLPMDKAAWLYGWANIGDIVIIKN